MIGLGESRVLSRRRGTCLLLKDLVLNLVLELLELMQLCELVLLLEKHLRCEGCGSGKRCRGRVEALERYQVRHGHEIERLLIERGIIRSCDILEGIWCAMRSGCQWAGLVRVLLAILVLGRVCKEKGEKVLLLVILGGNLVHSLSGMGSRASGVVDEMVE